MPAKPAVCLVSPAHLSNNPRLVKEADALAGAGYDVHVVCGRYFAPMDEHDAALLRAATWNVTMVDYGARLATLGPKLLHKWARRRFAAAANPSVRFAMRAHHRAALSLAAAASRVPAVYYIGHQPAGLAAGAHAARFRSTGYGFDAEDFHPAETGSVVAHAGEARALETLEKALLPRCLHFTAASPLIGEAYGARYGTKPSAILLNVFPRADAPASPPPPPQQPTENRPATLYWFSQTVGPSRGLEPFMTVLARMRCPVELHLRGLPAPGFPSQLEKAASSAGFARRIRFHPIAHTSEMARLARGHSLGLSLEQSSPDNRDLCLTNKIFTYLLAGLPVALTPTTAQRTLAASLGEAAMLIDLAAPDAAARALDALLLDTSRRASAEAEAWRLGQTRYNWDVEKETLLTLVAKVVHADD